MADTRERIVGQRYFNHGIDEAFTVVGVSNDGAMLFLQYDGTAWDEIATPNLLTEDVAKQLGVNEGSIDEEHYVPVGHGPTLTHYVISYDIPLIINI